MMNFIWLIAVIVSCAYMIFTGNAGMILESMLNSAKGAIELCISLCSIYCFWMGIMEVACDSGLMELLSRIMMPVLKRLFKNESDEAYKHISANLSANLIGVGNAATPEGIKAVGALSSGGKGGVATHNMMLFIVMNTSSLQLFPTTVIAMRRLWGSLSPGAIIPGVLITSLVGTATGIILCKIMAGLKKRGA